MRNLLMSLSACALWVMLTAVSSCGGVDPVPPTPIPPDPIPTPTVYTCVDACKVDPIYCEDWCENARSIPEMQKRINCVATSYSLDESRKCP